MNTEPLAPWERELLTGMSTAIAVVHLHDGTSIEFEDVNPDSIGPSAENKGVIGIEFMDDYDRVVHVPFVRFWEIQYR